MRCTTQNASNMQLLEFIEQYYHYINKLTAQLVNIINIFISRGVLRSQLINIMMNWTALMIEFDF